MTPICMCDAFVACLEEMDKLDTGECRVTIEVFQLFTLRLFLNVSRDVLMVSWLR